MKNILPGIIAFVIAFGCVAFDSARGKPKKEEGRYYLFVINFDHLVSKAAVEDPANWEFHEVLNEKSLFCNNGNFLACQLLVDARDTEINGKSNLPKLKPGVALRASMNAKGSYYYVSEYTSSAWYSYKVINGSE